MRISLLKCLASTCITKTVFFHGWISTIPVQYAEWNFLLMILNMKIEEEKIEMIPLEPFLMGKIPIVTILITIATIQMEVIPSIVLIMLDN